MKKFLLTAAIILASILSVKGADADKIVVAYVTSWSEEMPNPTWVTHINYAFGHVSDRHNGVLIDNEARLDSILTLKKEHPELKVLLSIGGWGSGGFSEMAADARLRRAFAWDCRRKIWDKGLDGIDIDWEYPGCGDAGISFSEQDKENYTLMMKEIRTAIGPRKILSQAVVSSAEYIDLRAVEKYVDYTNIMAYDMGTPPHHNAPLYHSDMVDGMTVAQSVGKFQLRGVPASKLVLGIPFYGRGITGFQEVKCTEADALSGYTAKWDDDAKVPYLTDRQGNMVYSYDNARSVSLKCQYAVEQHLKGVMIWSYDGDDEYCTLFQSVSNALSGKTLE